MEGTRDTGVVTELAVRRLHPSQDLDAFAVARDAFVARLREQQGVGTDREFAAVFDFASGGAPQPPVFIGMTEYDSSSAFAAAGEALGGSPEAAALFATFTPAVFTALRPLDPTARYDLADIAGVPGQVLEVASRDLSAYADFDSATYAVTRDAFLAALREEDGFVAEYQWVSALDPHLVVGMTVYADAAAFQGIAGSSFVQSQEYRQFLGTYPPSTGYASVEARTT